jgi:hypothetical protein
MILVELYPEIQDSFPNINSVVTVSFLKNCFDLGIKKKKHFKENEKKLKETYGKDINYILIFNKPQKKTRECRRLMNYYNWSFSSLTVKKMKIDFDLFEVDEIINKIKNITEC